MGAVATQSSHLLYIGVCGCRATCAPLFVSNYEIEVRILLVQIFLAVADYETL